MTGDLQKFLTEEQHMKVLRDEAIFSDISSAKIRAINELARLYDVKAIPVIIEVIDSLLSTEQAFRAFCLNTIDKIKQDIDDS